jgi:hypothetical protein
VNYEPTLSTRALSQMGGLPIEALGALGEKMAEVCEYPCDPLRTLPTDDPYLRRAVFGSLGLVTYRVHDAARIVLLVDVTWTG